MANIDLANQRIYEMVEPGNAGVVRPVTEQEVKPTQVQPATQSSVVAVKVEEKKENKIFNNTVGGFLLFVAIVVVIALFIYFTVYRLGWGVTECMQKNYHNCATLVTPEVAPLALTGLAALAL